MATFTWNNLPILPQVNGIRRMIVSPCAIAPSIYVETFFPAAHLALLMWLDQFTQVALMRSRLGKSPFPIFEELTKGIRPGLMPGGARIGRETTGGGGGGSRGCRFRGQGGKVIKQEPVCLSQCGGFTKALFVIDRALFTALFWFSIIDIVTRGLYNWLSLAHQMAQCEPDPENGPFTSSMIPNAVLNDQEWTASYYLEPGWPRWVQTNGITVSTGTMAGYIATVEAHDSLYATNDSLTVRNVMTPIGGAEPIELGRCAQLFPGGGGGKGVVANDLTPSPFGPGMTLSTRYVAHATTRPEWAGQVPVSNISGGTRTVWRT